MRLVKVEIEGYRSVTKMMELHVEPNVTVILGANDHGKTNLLHAIQHLNDENTFDAADDVNWDLAGRSELFPHIIWTFELNSDERNELLDAENVAREQANTGEVDDEWDEDQSTDDVPDEEPVANRGPVVPAIATAGATADPADREEEEEEESDEELEEELEPIVDAEVPWTITLVRRGVGGQLSCPELRDFDDAVVSRFLGLHKPRVELIQPWERISDAATADSLREENEFMRGIFYYAGLNARNSTSLFDQNNETQMRLGKASKQLNRTLKRSWSQGKELDFELRHDSESKSIELLIDDPAVESRYVRASRRSSGFTHYFALMTILHARQQEHPARSYILLFDEPGIFLHPSAQYDMLQALETLGKANQVLYVTHSLFMINKTFPTRHRLLIKDKGGTRLDGKPYVGRWGTVLSALGLSLTGTILFANHVVLCEGDADPILIQGVLQKLIAAGKCRLDLNSVTFVATGESKHTDVLIRMLGETTPKPRIGVLVDGDNGGKDRLDNISGILEAEKIPHKALVKGTTIEGAFNLEAQHGVERAIGPSGTCGRPVGPVEQAAAV